MKKSLLLVAIAVIGLIGYRFSQRNPASDGTLSPSPTSQENAPYSLIVLGADVSVKHEGQTAYTIVTDTVEVYQGSEIKTSTTGRASLVYPNGTITGIEEDSELKIAVLDEGGNKSRLELIFGGAVSKIKNSLTGSDYYEVQTENVVASVRGTMFTTQFRNKKSEVSGIENTVRVQARDPKLKKIIEGVLTDVKTGEKTEVNSDDLPSRTKVMRAITMNDEDFRKQALKKNIINHFEREDMDNAQVRMFMRKIKERNLTDRPFIEKMKARHLDEGDTLISPTLTPRVSPTPTRSATPNPTVIRTATPVPTATATATPVPTPTPTAVVYQPILESVYPRSLSAGQQFTLNGSYFKTSSGISQISAVHVGATAVQFSVLDSLTIFGYAPQLPGTHDVSITTKEGRKLTLTQALTIQ